MKVEKASVLGFCFGVRRAVELAETALKENQGLPVYSLGPLIHNEMALKLLETAGLRIVEEKDIDSIPNDSKVIIRAHGVTPTVVSKLEEKNCNIVDATCPRVKASQKMVERYSHDNDFVILTGDKNHGEVIGISGYAGKNFCLVQNLEEAQALNTTGLDNKNIILLSQTTYSPVEFEKIETLCKEKFTNCAVMNTICPATNERQQALLDLCKKVEAVLVIGGKNSANTKRLYQTAKENCKYAAHIQSVQDIPQDFFTFTSVGITAGASTPDSIIEEIEKRMI